MKITVTEKDILNGVPKQSKKCPVALAIKRAYKAKDVSVTLVDAEYIEGSYSLPELKTVILIVKKNDEILTFLAPPCVAHFVAVYDLISSKIKSKKRSKNFREDMDGIRKGIEPLSFELPNS